MSRKRRSFSPEFKQEAASLVLDQGYTIPQACVSLGNPPEKQRCLKVEFSVSYTQGDSA